MRVQLPVSEFANTGRRAVPTHGVRERYFEKIIVSDEQALKNSPKTRPFELDQVRQPQHVPTGNQQDLIRPRCPVGYDRDPLIILKDDAFILLDFELQIIEEQYRFML